MDKIKARSALRSEGKYLGARIGKVRCFGELSPLSGSGSGTSSSVTAGGVISRVPILESTATNLLLQSATFSNASWTKTNCVVVADSTLAPNGVVEADTLNDNDPANTGTVSQDVVIPNDALTRTLSCYFLAGTSTQSQIQLLLTGGAPVTQNVDFNPVSGQIIAQNGNAAVEAVVIGLTNWFRVSIPATNNTSGNVTARCTIKPASSNAGAQGTVIAWGAQLETGATASSQIPTTTAATARTAGKLAPWLLSTTSATRTILTAGAGNYTPPAGCIRINVRMWGAGAGGNGGFNDAVNTNNGTAGANTTFGVLTAGGAAANVGASPSGVTVGAPGTGANGDLNLTGSFGENLSVGDINGFPGGCAPFMGVNGVGGQAQNNPGRSAPVNSGGGGGGASSSSVGGGAAQSGGSGGGYCEKLIQAAAFAAPYAYSVGAKGVGGASGGAPAAAGGDGGSGLIIIDEFYV
jgi:hypothetical protein